MSPTIAAWAMRPNVRDQGPRQRRTATLESGPLHHVVYARHGHELMGWKSPVGVSDFSMLKRITTSRRQLRNREGPWEGSRSANLRVDEQKSHRRPSLRASQHKMTKPSRNGGQGKCGDCAGKVHALIRGDLFAWHCEHRRENPDGSPDDQRTWRPGGRPGGSERSSRTQTMAWGAWCSNVRCERTEVSRRRSSPTPAVMGGTW